MSLDWIKEPAAAWDQEKQRIVGGAPEGVFDRRFKSCADGDALPGDWWRVEEAGAIVGFGWLDVVWGEAEIQLATATAARRKGVGTFIIERLEAEAQTRGLNYVYNTVRPSHPDAAKVSAWLVERGFEPSADGSLLRAVVRHP